jgi:DNA-binding LytR/AlgR family response regulator
VASSLPAGRPRVVFCTAYEQYGPEAFDLRAVDYLLKPVTRSRLEETCRRLLEAPANPGAWPRVERLLARAGDRYVAVPLREVACFLADGKLTRLCGGRELLLEASLNELEARLGEQEFFRISRAALVRLDLVTEVRPLPGGTAAVALRDGRTLEVSRRRVPALLERLGRIR